MAKRIIPCEVMDEYVRGAGVPIGAAGSHDDVVLRLSFNEMWEGTARSIVWIDALGNTKTITDLLPTMLEETDAGTERDVYLVPVPAEPKKYPGEIKMTIKGWETEDGKEKSATLSATSYFVVMVSDWSEEAENSSEIDSDRAQEILYALEETKEVIVAAKNESKSYSETALTSSEEAANSAKNAKEHASAARSSAEDARTSAEDASAFRDEAAGFAESAEIAATNAAEIAAEGVKTATENAKAGAEKARDEAFLAASSAASSAGSAALSAEDAEALRDEADEFSTIAANNARAAETSAAQAAQSATEAKTAADAVVKGANNQCANALKGNASGAVVRVDDVSPLPHNLSVKVSGVDDPTAVAVKRYGKNLLPFPYSNGTKIINGITFTVNDDGSVTANGTASAGATFYCWMNASKPLAHLPTGTEIRLSGCPSDGSASTYYVGLINVGIYDYGKGAYYKIGTNTTAWGLYLTIYIAKGTTVENLVFKPQIEIGRIVTEYEPYIAPTTHTPDAGGFVTDALSASPTMTLLTDTAGAELSVEYNRDTNKVIESLVQAIISLGGNI